jgi:hypothetical protein
MVEYWDTTQRAYAPARLSAGLSRQPEPGDRPLLYAASARSAYTVQGVDRVIEPAHQVTRFVHGDSVVLRVDAAMAYASGDPDSSTTEGVGSRPGVEASPPRAALFLYDSAFTRRVSTTAAAALDGDTARATLFRSARAGSLVYSVELLGDSAMPAGRARYALDAHIPAAGPVVSDLLIAHRFAAADMPDRLDDPRLRAFESLIFRPGDTLGIYAEAYRLAGDVPVEIEVSLEDAGGPSLLGRFARWIGRGIGLLEPREEPRVSWRGEPGNVRYVVALNVPLPQDREGMHDLVLRITDPLSGGRAEARRRILIRP